MCKLFLKDLGPFEVPERCFSTKMRRCMIVENHVEERLFIFVGKPHLNSSSDITHVTAVRYAGRSHSQAPSLGAMTGCS